MRHPSDMKRVKPGRLHEIVVLLRRRLEGEEGFTLIELTIVLLILGILLTIAVPSYLSFKDRAAKTAAKADVAQTLRAVNSYAADNFPGAANDPDTGVANGTTDSGYTGIWLRPYNLFWAEPITPFNSVDRPRSWSSSRSVSCASGTWLTPSRIVLITTAASRAAFKVRSAVLR